MRRRASKQTLPDVRLGKEHLDVLLAPVLGGQALQEHHDFLEIHLNELIGPFHEEGGADVEVEFRESLFFGLGSCC